MTKKVGEQLALFPTLFFPKFIWSKCCNSYWLSIIERPNNYGFELTGGILQPPPIVPLKRAVSCAFFLLNANSICYWVIYGNLCGEFAAELDFPLGGMEYFAGFRGGIFGGNFYGGGGDSPHGSKNGQKLNLKKLFPPKVRRKIKT